jgi:hypothetical protein
MRIAARQRAPPFIGGPRYRGSRTAAREQQVMLSANGDDIRMPGGDPEWIEIIDLQAAKWIDAAPPAKA